MDLGRKFRKDKLTGLGESLNELERAEMERCRFNDQMNEYILQTVRGAKSIGSKFFNPVTI